MSRSMIRHAVGSGRMQSPHRGVVVTHGGPLSRDERDWVALLAAPPRAAISGSTALRWDRHDLGDDPTIHVTLPEGAARPTILGVTYHWSSELSDLDVHPLRRPRRTRIARSACDAAIWSTNDRVARAWVVSVVQQGLTSPQHLADALTRRGPCRRRSLIEESILDAAGGVHSVPEHDADRIIARLELPRPDRQVIRRGPDGRYYLDVHWSAWGITVEVHGAAHQEARSWDDGLLRQNDLVIDGDRVLVFSSFALRHRAETVSRQLLSIFVTAGWQPPR